MVVGLGNKRSTHSSHHHVGEQRRSSPYGRVGQLPHLPAEQTPSTMGYPSGRSWWSSYWRRGPVYWALGSDNQRRRKTCNGPGGQAHRRPNYFMARSQQRRLVVPHSHGPIPVHCSWGRRRFSEVVRNINEIYPCASTPHPGCWGPTTPFLHVRRADELVLLCAWRLLRY